ncbi:hypothetical protein UFOVP607_10 [uncultured Caudovirales phage]|uniref:Uncharacterized protein n=1 Tax=uncultured Caudovirales phage TaxID=2100421 RepID=A0A6J5N4X6_9CAUD|nr:hypothetical protein UFOVP607_10 [uncultured Caudovirales phage]
MSAINQLKSVLCNPDGKCCIHGSDADRAIIDCALQVLAKPVQEPVGYVTLDGEFVATSATIKKHGSDCGKRLYTSPPTREPLSEEEIDNVVYKAIRNGQLSWVGFKQDERGVYCLPVLSGCHYQLFRVSEAAHGIGVKP